MKLRMLYDSCSSSFAWHGLWRCRKYDNVKSKEYLDEDAFFGKIDMNTFLIMLSTYNGEKFLPELLDSLYNQENVNIHILVRDDGSIDATLKILEEYKKHFAKMSIIKGDNVGAAKSFFLLLSEAVRLKKMYDFYAFCDQDDVWMKNKLFQSAACLRKSNNTYQLLYCSTLSVDSNLNDLKTKVNLKIINDFYANIVSSRSAGCTQIFNYPLLQKVSKFSDNIDFFQKKYGVLPYHDGWVARVAYSLGADVVYFSEPLIYYRQHGNNVVGNGSSFLNLMKKRIRRYLNGKQKSCFCSMILDLYGKNIPEENLCFLKLCSEYDKSILKKMKLLFCKRMYQYGFTENIGLFFMILFNKF